MLFKFIVCSEVLGYIIPIREDEANSVEEACAIYLEIIEFMHGIPDDWDGFLRVLDNEGDMYEVECPQESAEEDDSPLYFFTVGSDNDG